MTLREQLTPRRNLNISQTSHRDEESMYFSARTLNLGQDGQSETDRATSEVRDFERDQLDFSMSSERRFDQKGIKKNTFIVPFNKRSQFFDSEKTESGGLKRANSTVN